MKLFEVNHNEAKLILKEGITHIDDQKLSVEKFLHVLKNLKNFEITEKVDGANLKFGLNMAGRFFTSRMGKEGKEYFSEEEWGKEFKDTAFRSAHLALEQKVDEMMKTGLEIGDIIEVEILFGTKPNAIPYWPNQIIFLKAIHGDPDIDNIANSLEGQKVNVEIKDVPYTLDGETIKRTDENHTWSFSQVQNFNDGPSVDSAVLTNLSSKISFILYLSPPPLFDLLPVSGSLSPSITSFTNSLTSFTSPTPRIAKISKFVGIFSIPSLLLALKFAIFGT